MNFESGRLEIVPEAEARTRSDRQVMTGMAADGFFLRLTSEPTFWSLTPNKYTFFKLSSSSGVAS